MNTLDVVMPFAVIAALLVSVGVIYRRQCRNLVLEEMVEKGEIGSIASFRGTLAVRESRPGSFLRLSKDSKGRRLQFWYRWIIGVGRQATVDEVTFDAGRQSVELIKNNKQKSLPFADFSAVGMREFSAMSGREFGGRRSSVWCLELVPVKGSRLLLLTSVSDYRQESFKQTAAVAKAVATIMSLPVQVVVDGKAWSRAWPPKNRVSFS